MQFTRPSAAKIEEAFTTYASNADGSLTENDLDCAVRYLTGSRLPITMRQKVTSMLEAKGGIGRHEFSSIVAEILQTETPMQLEDLWDELTGDEHGCIKKHTLAEWVYSAMGFSTKSTELVEQVWEQLDTEGRGIAGLREVKALLDR